MGFAPNDLITDVAAKLATVSGVGVVHTYRRKVQTEADAFALWVPAAGTKINAWSVSLGDGNVVNSERNPGFGAVGSGQAGRVLSDIAITIEGVAGIDDAAQSEVTFRATAWNVVMAFNREGKLWSYLTHQGPMQWRRFGYLVLASMYTVHYARFDITFTGQVLP
jgi:hypothetical protein